METVKTRGIVARRADYGEANTILTVITDKLGVVSACVYGVRSKKNRMKAGAQVLCCSDFVLSRKGGEVYRVDSMEIVDGFAPISEDLTLLALGNYFCEAVCGNTAEDCAEQLRLLLNTLYLLAYKNFDVKTAKAVFELKMMQYAGYMPVTDRCIRCGKSGAVRGFSLSGGTVCSECVSSEDIKLSDGVYRALRHILSAEGKSLYSFSASDEVRRALSALAEKYLLHKTERRYKSLEYLKKIM